MPDPTNDNDIDALLDLLAAQSRFRFHAALTALVAERDAALKRISLLLLADEQWHTAIASVEFERARLRERVAAQDAALTALVAERDALKQRVTELEANPPADSDRELRERLLESALQGLGCRLVILKESDAEELGRQAVWIVNGALAAMRKGER
jgi:hypothetical protein